MRKITFTIFGIFCASLLTGSALAEPASAELIQSRIDQAEPGAVLYVPAGVYHGSITLKHGITLVGAGADQTILDGGKAHCVVTAEKNSALIGFTIRNGITGIWNQGNYIGIFNCRFEDIQGLSAKICRGSGVIGNNEFVGHDKKTTGLTIHNANPYVFSNVFSGHRNGITVCGTQIPYITRNNFNANQTGIRFHRAPDLLLYDNRFTDNEVEVAGREVIEELISDAYAGVSSRLSGEASPTALCRIMDVLYPRLVATHSKVTYDLRELQPGKFYASTKHHTATFCVHASTRETRIPAYDAYDRDTDADLQVEYRPPDKLNATVVAKNESLPRFEQDRYVLDALYEDEDAWFITTDGTWRFVRKTNFSRIAVMIPPGFEVVSFNHDVQPTDHGDYTALEFSDVGITQLDLVLQAIAP